MTSTSDFINEFTKTHREIQHALEKTVRISYDEVLGLVVDDLLTKYRRNVADNNQEWAVAFAKVLRYYLTAEEMAERGIQ